SSGRSGPTHDSAPWSSNRQRTRRTGSAAAFLERRAVVGDCRRVDQGGLAYPIKFPLLRGVFHAGDYGQVRRDDLVVTGESPEYRIHFSPVIPLGLAVLRGHGDVVDLFGFDDHSR